MRSARKVFRQLGRDVGGGDLAGLAQGVLHVLVAGVAVGGRERRRRPAPPRCRSPRGGTGSCADRGRPSRSARCPCSMLRPCSVSRKKPPYAASTWNQQRSRSAMVAMASSGSTAPVSVVPAAAMISQGLSPGRGRRRSPASSASGRIRKRSSIGDVTDLRLAQARDAERLLEAVMGLRGQVDDRRGVIGALAGRGRRGPWRSPSGWRCCRRTRCCRRPRRGSPRGRPPTGSACSPSGRGPGR